MSGTENPDQSPELLAWQDNAATWIAHSDHTALMTRGASDALVQALAPGPGNRVLDVASGTGDPAFDIAVRVGPEGHVLATDGVNEMLLELSRRAEQRGLTWVQTRHVAAEELAFEAREFDAAGCRFGAMFFSDPARALANMARAVRPGGSLAVVVWAGPEHNPYFTLTSGALDEVGAPGLPAGKTVFEFADGESLAELASAAGWCQVEVRREPFSMLMQDVTPDTLLEAHRVRSGRIARRLEGLSPQDTARVSSLLSQRAAPYATPAGLDFPAVCLLVRGTAP